MNLQDLNMHTTWRQRPSSAPPALGAAPKNRAPAFKLQKERQRCLGGDFRPSLGLRMRSLSSSEWTRIPSLFVDDIPSLSDHQTLTPEAKTGGCGGLDKWFISGAFGPTSVGISTTRTGNPTCHRSVFYVFM